MRERLDDIYSNQIVTAFIYCHWQDVANDKSHSNIFVFRFQHSTFELHCRHRIS